MLTFKLLHILSMVAMVTTQIGAEFFYAIAISRRDAPALAAVHRVAEQSRVGILSIVFLIAGVVFGLLTAATGGFDFLDGWLIAAYVLVAVFVVLAGRQAGRITKLGNEAVESQNEKRSVEDVVRQMAASRALVWFGVDLVLVVALIADMVLKPF